MADLRFDATQHEPATGRPEPFPPGEYTLMVTDSEMKVTDAGNGSYLSLEITVCDGEYQGRKMWVNLNLDNPSQKAVEIANRELSALCHAVGVLQVADSTELHNIPFQAKVKIKPAKGNFDTSNAIGAYLPRGAAVTQQQQAAQPAQAAAGGAPWQTK